MDFRTDIYSLGIVMYEMLTGQVPYNGETSISVVMMHIQEPIIPPKEVITDIPENINKVILKALEKEPINRFQTSKELAEILNAIKDNFNLEVNFNSRSIDATTIMMMKPDAVLSDSEIDFTTVMNQATNPETLIIKKDRKKLSKNNGISKNKKIMLTIGLIILAIIVCILWKYIPNESSTDTKAIVAETTLPEEPEESVTPPANENKLVPSLIGKTQDIAENTIVNNGFLLGNITNEYSDTVPKGLIISQSPSADTYYGKNEKIDLVISQGQKVTQVVPQISGKEKVNEKANERANEKANEKSKKVKNNK